MDEQEDELRQRECKERLRERNGCVNEERSAMQRVGGSNGGVSHLPLHVSVVLAGPLEMPFSHPFIPNEFPWILEPGSHPEVFLQLPSLPSLPFVPR